MVSRDPREPKEAQMFRGTCEAKGIKGPRKLGGQDNVFKRVQWLALELGNCTSQHPCPQDSCPPLSGAQCGHRDIASKDMANPEALLLSEVMLPATWAAESP